MKITGNVEDISLSSIKFVDLKGKEGRCSETLQPFEKGEKVIAITLGDVIESDSIKLSDGIYFVKLPAASDFLLRFLDSVKQSESLTQEIEKPVENP